MRRAVGLTIAFFLIPGLLACSKETASTLTPSPSPTLPPVSAATRAEVLEFARAVNAIRMERDALSKDVAELNKLVPGVNPQDTINEAIDKINRFIAKDAELQSRMFDIKRPSVPSARAVQDNYLIAFTREIMATTELAQALSTVSEKKAQNAVYLRSVAQIMFTQAEEAFSDMLDEFSISPDELK